MSPESLIGMELGKAVLQRQLAQGTIGTVYLGDQVGLQRQVAVKVFLSASLLKQAEQEEFLQRIQEEIMLGASLDHAHILPILAHGERQGLVYQITPYVTGGNLQKQLDQSGALSFEQVQRYLEDLASALDYAHARGIFHRDVKPNNILLAANGKLLLADFAIAGVTTEKNFARIRRVAPGMLNCIAPEYVMGKQIDQRADIYSLGTVLFHMVTGEPPFKSTSIEELAMKQVKATPPAPTLLRPDLPPAASRVLLRALAKRPADRYSQAQDLAIAFRLALEEAHLLPAEKQSTSALALLADLAGGSTKPMVRLTPLRGESLFDSKWQAPPPFAPVSVEQQSSDETAPFAVQARPSIPEPAREAPTSVSPPMQIEWSGETTQQRQAQPTPSALQSVFFSEPSVLPEQMAFPEQIASPVPLDQGGRRTGLLSRTHLPVNAQVQPLIADRESFVPLALSSQVTQEAVSDSTLHLMDKPVSNTEELRVSAFQQPEVTGMLGMLAKTPINGDNTGTIKLTEPVKIIQVPVAGQPGHFITGFLPVQSSDLSESQNASAKTAERRQIVKMVLALLVIVVGSSILWSTRSNSHSNSSVTPRAHHSTPNIGASATAYATATVGANTILSDSLNQNIHNWPVGQQGSFSYAFKDGMYEITNNDNDRSAPALLPDKVLTGPFVYSLRMEQLKGDQSSPNNQFGMILYASIQDIKGKQIDKFYAFEVLNRSDGEYQFWKYDNSKSGSSPWNMLWSKKFGHEFSHGTGSSHINTLRVAVNGKSFTFTVNGHKVGVWKDGSFSNGSVGMLVNLKGAEVAFSNLLLTYM